MNSGGIGGLLQDKVDAYRGQPERLAASYQNNQQLLDLLALQKIKSEKEAAARQMQLDIARKMGTPPTVAAQREKEVFDLTKNEIAQQSAVGGQQIAAQQQEAMSGGIASQPAPNMTRMASGGIVGFAEGGDVDYSRETPFVRWLREALRRELPESVGDPIADAVLQSKPASAVRSELQDVDTDAALNIPSDVDLSAALNLPAETPTPTAAPEAPARSRVQDADFAAPQPVAPTSPARRESGILKLLEGSVEKGINADPAAASASAAARYRELMRNQEAEGKRQSVQDRLEAEYEKQNDPKRQRREQLSAFLRGAAGRSGAGSTLAGGSEGIAAVRSAQDASRVKQLQDMQGYYNERVKELQAQGLGQFEAEQRAAQDVAATARTSMQTGAELLRQDMTAAEGAADRASRERIANSENALRSSLASAEVAAELQKAAQLAGVKSREEYTRLIADLIKEGSSDPVLMTEIMANPEQKDALFSDWLSKRAAMFDVMAGTVQAR